LFVGSDFLASNSCFYEIQEALKQHEVGNAKVISIILRPCLWKDSPLSQLQVLPQDGKPITKWDNLDEATLNVAEGIMKVVCKLAKKYNGTGDSETGDRFNG
jgi:hypothetical protein